MHYRNTKRKKLIDTLQYEKQYLNSSQAAILFYQKDTPSTRKKAAMIVHFARKANYSIYNTVLGWTMRATEEDLLYHNNLHLQNGIAGFKNSYRAQLAAPNVSKAILHKSSEIYYEQVQKYIALPAPALV